MRIEKKCSTEWKFLKPNESFYRARVSRLVSSKVCRRTRHVDSETREAHLSDSQRCPDSWSVLSSPAIVWLSPLVASWLIRVCLCDLEIRMWKLPRVIAPHRGLARRVCHASGMYEARMVIRLTTDLVFTGRSR